MDNYIAKKMADGEWGDDIEIQALSEIYQKPIEIYAYSVQPMKTFHEAFSQQEQVQKVVPFRLSFHGN